MSSPVVVLQAGVLCPAFTTTTNGRTGILQAVGKFHFYVQAPTDHFQLGGERSTRAQQTGSKEHE
jgi:hypothetical protein